MDPGDQFGLVVEFDMCAGLVLAGDRAGEAAAAIDRPGKLDLDGVADPAGEIAGACQRPVDAGVDTSSR